MRIALFGHGRMGKAIEEVALSRGHQVVLRVTSANADADPTGADVIIEFSRPEHAVDNMRRAMEHRIPIVVGTTGWYDRMPQVRTLVAERQGTLLWASNFSIGVNLFFRLNRQLAAWMDRRPEYAARIDEVHHIHKADAPSGTAISLAHDIDLRTQRYAGWELITTSPAMAGGAETPSPLPIRSERTGEVPGKHSVTWAGPEDRITITHEAFGRRGFAIGAVIAAEWLQGRKGLFTMDDVLDLHA